MLQWIRERKRIAQVILILLVFPFACTGIDQYRRSHSDTDVLARVGGQKITQAEFDETLRDRLDRMRSMMGSNFDAALFDTPEARQSILDQLINHRVLQVAVEEAKLSVSDEQLRDFIMAAPIFQQDGQFNLDRYRQFLVGQRKTELEFESLVRADLSQQKFVDVVEKTSIAPTIVALRQQEHLQERRAVQSLLLSPSAFISKVQPTDQQVAEYYDKHKVAFETPESIDIEYVVLSPEILAQKISVSPSEVKTYYEQNLARYKTEEQRRASHILIASTGDKKAAKAKAEKILAEVRTQPNAFAELAKKYSEDPGSKDKGGDLDFFGKGAMVPAFETAVFKLKEGETSDLVESEFGFHIIRLTGMKAAQMRSLEAVRTDIENDIRLQRARKKYAEAATAFTDTVYEQADSLQPVADKLGLSIERAQNLTRAGKFTPDFLSHGKLREALFADDAVRQHRNTAAVEVSPSTLVAARVVKHYPRSILGLNEVRAEVVRRVSQELALNQVRQAGESRLKALQLAAKETVPGNTKDTSGLGPLTWVSRQSPGTFSPDVIRAIFKVNAQSLPLVLGVDLGEQGYGIYRVAEVTKSKSSEAPDQLSHKQYASVLSEAEMVAFMEALKARLGVKILKK